MQINYLLIALSFIVPIAALGLKSTRVRHKINPRVYVIEWLANGFLACLIQLVATEIPFVEKNKLWITIVAALFGGKLYVFADDNIVPYLKVLLKEFIKSSIAKIRTLLK